MFDKVDDGDGDDSKYETKGVATNFPSKRKAKCRRKNLWSSHTFSRKFVKSVGDGDGAARNGFGEDGNGFDDFFDEDGNGFGDDSDGFDDGIDGFDVFGNAVLFFGDERPFSKDGADFKVKSSSSSTSYTQTRLFAFKYF